MHPTSGDHLPIRNAHENDHESIDTPPAGAPRQAPDDERTLTPTFQQHYCMPFCKSPCDIKGHMIWHHEEPVRYTPEELAERDRTWAEWREEMRSKGVLP